MFLCTCLRTRRWLRRLAAIFFQQLLGRVVLGCDLEFLDCLVTLLLELVEGALSARNSIVKQASTSCPHNVDSVSEKLSVAVRRGSQWSSYKTGPQVMAIYSLDPQLSHPNTSARIIE